MHFPLVSLSTSGPQRHPEANETNPLEERSKAAEHQHITSESGNLGILAGSWEELGRCWCIALAGFPTALPIPADTDSLQCSHAVWTKTSPEHWTWADKYKWSLRIEHYFRKSNAACQTDPSLCTVPASQGEFPNSTLCGDALRF